MDILLLSTPAQHTAENLDVILDPKSLIKWIDKLPIMNLPETVKLLHTSISSLNELMVSDKQRLKLIEIYYDSLQDILVSYDEMRISMLQIEAQKRNELREDIMWLYLSLAGGYKLIIKNAFEKGMLNSKESNLLTIYIAMELIIEGLVYGYSSHQTPPPLARLEINQLYALAMHNDISEKEIKGTRGHEQPPTLSRLFKQYILLTISNPYQLNSSDVLELFMFLEPIVDDCVIELNGSPEPPEGRFIIDLSADVGPISCCQQELSPETNDLLVIDVWPIINVLGLMVSEHKKEESIIAVQQQHMIEIVIEQLGRKSMRKSKRESVLVETQVIMGIEAVHHNLSKSRTGNSEVIDYSGVDKYPVSKWMIKNRNESGYMLETYKENIRSNIIVGDVIGFPVKYSETECPFQFSIVRWIQHIQNNMVQIGAESLPGITLPIFYKVESDYGVVVDDGTQLLGLYFPADIKTHTPESILINKQEYRQNQSIILENNSRMYKVNITALLRNSPLFVQLKFKKKEN
ncbi:hypothetical protein MNBD_GAMMA21-505 [hydrothermal vent metagenome]|uniref:Uncharacterized protein n=1 Tax=hydrothermal vent metagenome TaxID=652676 RepID=A0A3B1A184_9ZZZZ